MSGLGRKLLQLVSAYTAQVFRYDSDVARVPVV